jgi:sucrose phosphorylase
MTQNEKTSNNRGVILNLYPDSCGGNLTGLITLLKKPEMKNVFTTLYLLPSLFQSDLDRGFSIISYDMDNKMGTGQDLKEIQDLGYRLKLDFVLNHLSVQSPQFQDLLKKGNSSPYKEFFIDWNQFWKGEGTIGDNGCIIPSDKWLNRLFMRKPGLPVLGNPLRRRKHSFLLEYLLPGSNRRKGRKKVPGSDGSKLKF